MPDRATHRPQKCSRRMRPGIHVRAIYARLKSNAAITLLGNGPVALLNLASRAAVAGAGAKTALHSFDSAKAKYVGAIRNRVDLRRHSYS
jgi:hypothetical protein